MHPSELELHDRQLGILDPRVLVVPVTVIGVGAVGSAVARVLSQLGFRTLCLIDPDVVEPQNIGMQFYSVADTGQPKVRACKKNLQFFLPHLAIETRARAYRGEPLDGIVVSGVDRAEARRTIWRCVRFNPAVPLFVDGRTAGEEVHGYAIRPCFPEDIAFFERHLPADQDTAQIPCTETGAPHALAILAGLMANQIVRWVRAEPVTRWFTFFPPTMHLMTASI